MERIFFDTVEKVVRFKRRNGAEIQVKVFCSESCSGGIDISNAAPPGCPFLEGIKQDQIITPGTKPSALKQGTCMGTTIFQCMNI